MSLLSLFIFLLFSHLPSSALSSADHPAKFVLDPSKLELLLRRAALMALLRAKAKSTLGQVSLVDRVLFGQCMAESEAKCPVGMAKCVAKLIEARDRKDGIEEIADGRKLKENGRSGGGIGGRGGMVRMRHWKKRMKMDDETGSGKDEGRKGSGRSERLARMKHLFKLWKNRKKAEERIRDERSGRLARMKRISIVWRKKTEGSGRRMRMNWGRRRRRMATSKSSSKLPPALSKNMLNLRTLGHYARVLERCRRFIERMQAQNIQLLSRFDSPVKVPPPASGSPPSLDFSGLPERGPRISLLSPRLLSLFSDSAPTSSGLLLSLDLVSLSSADHPSASPRVSSEPSALLSVPRLLKMAQLGERESGAWLDLLLDASGTGKMLSRLVERLRVPVERMEAEWVPRIESAERAERRWSRMMGTMDAEQRRAAERHGYAHMRQGQRRILFPEEAEAVAETSGAESAAESAAERSLPVGGRGDVEVDEAERSLEAKIAELARLGDERAFWDPDEFTAPPLRQEQKRRRRRRRQTAPTQEAGVPAPIPRTILLDPFGFDTRSGGVVLEGIYLSPTVFFNELTSPEVLSIRVLSPLAFYSVILSPAALFARVLSPEVFRLQVLSPEALDTYILTPEAFMAEVLSPFGAEARVAAPRGMFVQILGPVIGSVYVASPDILGILVLSPYILTPLFHSEDRYMIEILSPHILSDEFPAENEEGEDHKLAGGTVKLAGWSSHKPGGDVAETQPHGGEAVQERWRRQNYFQIHKIQEK